MKVRLIDIARAAGVSTATVDRVLNNRKGVDSRTNERVRLAQARLREAVASELENRISRRVQSKTFDFLIPSGTNFFLAGMAEEVERKREEFALLGIKLRVCWMPGFDAKSIAAHIKETAGGSDGIGVVAIDHPLVREAIGAATSAGVPVVTLCSDVQNSGRTAYVGIDNIAAGRLAGDLMGRFLGGRRGEVALIAGSFTYRGHAQRALGFREVLQEACPNLHVANVREGKDDNVLSCAAAIELLEKHPNLIGIYNIGGGTPGVADALVRTAREDIVFIAHELNSTTRDLLVGGVIDAVLNQDASREVSSAVRMLMNFTAGREITANVDRCCLEVFFRENLP